MDEVLPAPAFADEIAGQAHIAVLPGTVPRRRSWRKRRFQLGVLAILIIAAAVATAIARGHRTRIIFINAGDEPLPVLTVTAAGHTHSVPPLEARVSYQWELPAGGTADPVHLRSATEAEGVPWMWQGNPVNPDGGTSLILRLWPDGTVEESTESSVWHALLGD